MYFSLIDLVELLLSIWFFKDGDDEMTDYHHEAGDGSVSGIPSINVWKEDTFMEDLKLKSVLHESVSNMLDSRRKGNSQTNFNIIIIFYSKFVMNTKKSAF